MYTPSVQQLIPVLHTAIGPTILISGVGLLLLTMTNRLGRIIDRFRTMHRDFRTASAEEQVKIAKQESVLWRRARLVRVAIWLAAMSALFAAILIIILFLTALLQLESPWVIVALFSVCMLSVIGSLVVFISDINLSLEAIKLELELSKQ